ncbi:isoprenoid synthase domain-containing protein [Aspergillus heterothallicus]
MANIYSDPVDCQLFAAWFPTRLNVRKSKYDDLALDAMYGFAQQWMEAGGMRAHACGSPMGSIVSFCLPNARPETIPVLARLIEFLIMMDVDSARGNMLIDASEQYLSRCGASLDILETASWNNWLSCRLEDGACYVYLTAIIFACGLDLAPDDLEPIWSIIWKGMAMTLLVNDIHSFDGQMAAQLNTEEDPPLNGVHRLMQQRGLTVEQAKEALYTEHIVPLENRFIEEKARFIREHEWDFPGLNLYLEQLEYMVAGTWYWGSRCYRYHEWKESLTDYEHVGWPCYSGSRIHEAATATWSIGEFPEQITKSIEGRTVYRPRAAKEIAMASSGASDAMNDQPRWGFDDRHISAPIKYVEALPSNNITNLLVEALGPWFTIPQATLELIQSIVSDLQHASQLLDDIQHQSPLSCGKPAAYYIFGLSQTTNSATFVYLKAMKKVMQLSRESQEILLDELEKLKIGQSYELHWARSCSSPSIDEYMDMIRMKASGFLSKVGRLIYAEAEEPKPFEVNNLISFLILLGQLAYLREDYLNLTSAEANSSTEELDRGRFSLPLIHLLENMSDRLMIEEILAQRSREGKMTKEMKQLVLEKMAEARSLEFVNMQIQSLETRTKIALGVLEQISGVNNYMLQYFITRLAQV